MSDVMFVRTNARYAGGPPPGRCGPMERRKAEALIARGSAVDCSKLEDRVAGRTPTVVIEDDPIEPATEGINRRVDYTPRDTLPGWQQEPDGASSAAPTST